MSANYSLFRNPKPGKKGEADETLHARLVNQRIIRTAELAADISDACSFTTADVKGMLEALKKRLAFHLQYGAIIELEGLGTFSVSLKCPALTDEKDIKPKQVQFNKVVFRCSKELRSGLKFMEVERANEGSRLKVIPLDKRKTNILEYIARHGSISTALCRGINGCSKYLAQKDLKALMDEGRVVRLGYRSNAQYGLAKKEEREDEG
ncbi:HU family DNA-binding protein [uncultured Parabacteroides sp.]|uniref:HU family DNA-binding protein n=4 Tax=Parabacteroides TaxID=375288 RepID=UPI0025FA1B2B|nr:HU family DNA-binding protein [uncultured Parabacteroides sp.]